MSVLARAREDAKGRKDAKGRQDAKGLITAVRAATAAMGTRFEIVVASGDESAVRPLLEEAVCEIEELHVRFTRFSRDSLLSHINRTAARVPVRLDRGTFELFRAASEVHAASDGAFDIAIGSGGIVLDATACTIAFDRDGVQLDLGAIAKGFALDRAAAILRVGGITSALLHGGTSSVVAIGTPPDASAWRVALARGRALPWVDLCDAALSVSHSHSTHIVDPRSGAAAERRFAVVMGPSACIADAWSTALAVAGAPPAGLPSEYTVSIEPEYE